VGANWVEFRAVNKLGDPHHATTTAIDIQNFINERPFTNFQKIVLALCFLVVAANGFDTAAIGFIAPRDCGNSCFDCSYLDLSEGSGPRLGATGETRRAADILGEGLSRIRFP
jgi:hypothetical protein